MFSKNRPVLNDPMFPLRQQLFHSFDHFRGANHQISLVNKTQRTISFFPHIESHSLFPRSLQVNEAGRS
jgi:hypothetical protein